MIKPINLSRFHTENVINMRGMFIHPNLMQKITRMIATFDKFYWLKSINLSGFLLKN